MSERALSGIVTRMARGNVLVGTVSDSVFSTWSPGVLIFERWKSVGQGLRLCLGELSHSAHGNHPSQVLFYLSVGFQL